MNGPRNRNFGQKAQAGGFEGLLFYNFWGLESRLLDFLKVIFKRFRKYSDSVFNLKRPTFS